MSAARLVAGLTALSRVAGLIRDGVCSRIFGAGPVWSSFALAFVLPNLFRRLFGEGALTAAFVPEYAQLRKHDPDLADRFATATALLVALGLAVVTLAIEGALLVILKATPLGESGGLTLRLAMIMLPFMPLVCLTALLGGMLQTHDRFGPTAAAPIILNFCMIAAAVGWGWFSNRSLEIVAIAVAVSVVAAGLLQTAWSLAALRSHLRWRRRLSDVGAPMRRLFQRMGPALIGLGALQINTFLDGLIAGWPVLVGPTIGIPGVGAIDYPLDEASNAVLFFSQRLYQFPLGVFGIALATAVFPALSRFSDDAASFRETLVRGLRLAVFIGLPASVGLIAVRSDLTAVILGGGRFGEADATRVAAVLLGYATAVWAYVASHVLTRAFYASGDTTTPMRVSLATVGANLALNLALIWPLGEAGLAWSSSICATAQCGALAMIWRRRGAVGLDGASMMSGIRFSALLTGAMAIALGVLAWLRPLTPVIEGWGGHLVWLIATVAIGAGTYLALAWRLGRPEMAWLIERNVARNGAD